MITTREAIAAAVLAVVIITGLALLCHGFNWEEIRCRLPDWPRASETSTGPGPTLIEGDRK